jgi:hypothetical protein
MWVAVAVAAVLVLGGGGFAAWKFLLHHTTSTGATGAPTAAASQPGSGGGSPEASTPTPAPTASTPAQTTPSAVPSTPGSGFPVAATATVAAQPGEQQVVEFLQAWFTAINNHNYGEYTSLVTSSQRPTLGGFESGFGSTTDSNATLTGLAATANGMAATLTFTSHQQPSASPTGTLCDKWHITLFLQAHNGGYRDGAAPPGYHAHDRAC